MYLRSILPFTLSILVSLSYISNDNYEGLEHIIWKCHFKSTSLVDKVNEFNGVLGCYLGCPIHEFKALVSRPSIWPRIFGVDVKDGVNQNLS